MPASSRLEFRLADDSKERLATAAELVGEPVSEFVRRAAEERANQVLREQREWVVPPDYFDQLLAALDEPPAPNERLAGAAQRASSIVRQE